MQPNQRLNDSLEEARILGLFKAFCEKNASFDSQQRIRNIYCYSLDFHKTTQNLFLNELGEKITDEESTKLYELIMAFLKKSPYRKNIPDSIRKSLLNMQNYKCAICGEKIDIHAHLDHTVPFKYVGDELENNYQMLCTTCNLKKNASIDFQIRFLLKTI